MAHHVRSLENLPEEVAELAEVAAQLVEADPENRQAIADLSAVLGAGGVVGAAVGADTAVATLPLVVAAAAGVVAEHVGRSRRSMALPREERELWEDAGAVFVPRAVEIDAVRAAAAFADLLMRSLEGDAAVADRLGVDRSRVSQRLRDRSLYAFNEGSHRYFPSWQFLEQRTLPGLREVLEALDEGLHPLVVDHWFTSPSVDLEIDGDPASPVTWLSTGGTPAPVAQLAADL